MIRMARFLAPRKKPSTGCGYRQGARSQQPLGWKWWAYTILSSQPQVVKLNHERIGVWMRRRAAVRHRQPPVEEEPRSQPLNQLRV